MAFSNAVVAEGRTIMGDKRVVMGTFTNAGGDTGGDLDTGLSQIDCLMLTHTGSGTVASAPAVNETFPLSAGDPTIVTVDGADGLWIAIGK